MIEENCNGYRCTATIIHDAQNKYSWLADPKTHPNPKPLFCPDHWLCFYELQNLDPFKTPNEIRDLIIQPERSKREDSQKCEMRCSEHCSNAVREAK